MKLTIVEDKHKALADRLFAELYKTDLPSERAAIIAGVIAEAWDLGYEEAYKCYTQFSEVNAAFDSAFKAKYIDARKV